jgi:hypothetical protein
MKENQNETETINTKIIINNIKNKKTDNSIKINLNLKFKQKNKNTKKSRTNVKEILPGDNFEIDDEPSSIDLSNSINSKSNNNLSDSIDSESSIDNSETSIDNSESNNNLSDLSVNENIDQIDKVIIKKNNKKKKPNSKKKSNSVVGIIDTKSNSDDNQILKLTIFSENFSEKLTNIIMGTHFVNIKDLRLKCLDEKIIIKVFVLQKSSP